MWNTPGNVTYKDIFDQEVLAVAPHIAGRIFQPLGKATAQIPTTMVQNIVHGDGMKVALNDTTSSSFESRGARAAQIIRLRTSSSLAQTESIHIHSSGAMVIT
jgi:hypothetical protein